MSNLFYKKIADRLIGYFRQQSFRGGERYYLQFETSEQVRDFGNALQEHLDSVPFHYPLENGSVYETFALKKDSIRLVVAVADGNVTPDFLVTLRNRVGEQRGIWKNTALLSLCYEQLDSIQGGSSNLQKEGMPLHVRSLTSSLEEEIRHSVLTQTDRMIALYHLKQLREESTVQQTSFLDFKELLILLEKGSVQNEDYSNLGLFRMEELDGLTEEKAMERLLENHRLFEEVRRAHEFGKSAEDLEKNFSQSGVKALAAEDWDLRPFSKVYGWHKEFLDQQKKTKLEFKKLACDQELTVWERPLREDAVGRRKRHVVIFNPDFEKEEINLKIDFELIGSEVKTFRQDFVSQLKKDPSAVTASGKSLKITIPCQTEGPVFSKFSYKHEGRSAASCEFNIAVIPCEEQVLKQLKTRYTVNTKEKVIETKTDSGELIFGMGSTLHERTIETYEEVVEIPKEESLCLKTELSAYDDEDQLLIYLEVKGYRIPLMIRDDLPKSAPITGFRIWKLKRENQLDFDFDGNRLIQGNREYYPHSDYTRFFEWENQWVQQGLGYAEVEMGNLRSIDLELDSRLEEAYRNYLHFFAKRKKIPSLTYMGPELVPLAEAYVKEYIRAIHEIRESEIPNDQQRNLMKLGTVQQEGTLYLTPLHPLVVAFQLTLEEQIGSEQLEYPILERLRPDELLPYLYDSNDCLLKPFNQQKVLEWIIYKPVQEVTVGDANRYVAKVVEDKIRQFRQHFGYLFAEGSNAPLKLNVINISNDEEVLKGIFQWILSCLEQEGEQRLKPIDVYLYRDPDLESAFEVFSRLETVENLVEKFGIQVRSKKYDPSDVFRIARESIRYFKLEPDQPYCYAHISFYRMKAQEKHARSRMEQMVTGLGLKGLVSTVPSVEEKDDYRSGFGLRAFPPDGTLLIETAVAINELAANMINDGSNPYRKGESIVTRVAHEDETELNHLYDSSYWVTFIDPRVDLDFFQNGSRDLIIIHYSDQYTSSNRYDAITVTQRVTEYRKVIEEFLHNKNIEGDQRQIRDTIRAFNTFNGEWLLRIIGAKGQYSREKLSVVSAIRYCLAYLDHPDFLWVPISLEEILRVAGAVQLPKEGVFSAKSLGLRGAVSDDLLLIGLDLSSQRPKLHFYPVEVKIGLNHEHVLEKAKEQVCRTRELLDGQLNKKDESGKLTFQSRYYRNFFVQLLLSNAKKMAQASFWPEKDYTLDEHVVESLLKEKYDVSDELRPEFGDGAVLSFRKGTVWRSSSFEDKVMLLNFTEEDGYWGIVVPCESLKKKLLSGALDLDPKQLPAVKLRSGSVYEETATTIDHQVPELVKEAAVRLDERSKNPISITDDEQESASSVPLEKVRVLLGNIQGSRKKLYWEFGHRNLANRHLLISGKSGQGKTYFMQCLLLEFARQGISSIIIDYTDGFKTSQLEEEFKEELQGKISQILVKRDRFPINPFKRNERELDEGVFDLEDDTDVAERIKSVIGAVYRSLGIQQLNAIYQASMSGLRKYGDGMNLGHLREELELDGSSNAKSALSQLNPLIDRNPFDDRNNQNWKEIIEGKGKVFVVQLTGYPRDVQLLITEFILWDLWNYSLTHGNKKIPMPVVMDEAQNLDHTEKSPSARILTEGRKFGWSSWYATQFLKSQLSADELARLQNASQKVFFAPPESEIGWVASGLSQEPAERREWEQKLAQLKKGQCVVYGPVLRDDGTLTNPIPAVIEITSLAERLR